MSCGNSRWFLEEARHPLVKRLFGKVDLPKKSPNWQQKILAISDHCGYDDLVVENITSISSTVRAGFEPGPKEGVAHHRFPDNGKRT